MFAPPYVALKGGVSNVQRLLRVGVILRKTKDILGEGLPRASW